MPVGHPVNVAYIPILQKYLGQRWLFSTGTIEVVFWLQDAAQRVLGIFVTLSLEHLNLTYPVPTYL
jgi:hypothetical protein